MLLSFAVSLDDLTIRSIDRVMMATLRQCPGLIFALWLATSVSTGAANEPDVPCEITISNATFAVPDWAGQRKSEPFDVRGYIERRKQERTQAACEYLIGMARYWPRVAALSQEATRDGKVAAATALNEGLLKLIPDFEPSPKTWDEDQAQRTLDELQPVLAAFDAAQRHRNAIFPQTFTFNDDLVHVEAAQAFVRVGAVEVRLKEQSRERDAVERSLQRLFRLSRDLRPCGAAIQQVIAGVVSRMACLLMESEILARNQLTADDCMRLVKMIEQHEATALNGLEEAVRTEYVMQGNLLTRLRNGAMKLSDLNINFSPPEKIQAIDYDVEWRALNELSRFLLSDYAKMPFHETLEQDQYLKRLDNIREKALRQYEQPFVPDEKWKNSALVILVASDYPQVREARAREQVRTGAIKALLLVRRYELEHGYLPQNLDDAFKDAKAGEIPGDPYSGGQLKYRVREKTVTIYSLGRDQQDDGGEIDWNEGQQPGDFIMTMPMLKSE